MTEFFPNGLARVEVSDQIRGIGLKLPKTTAHASLQASTIEDDLRQTAHGNVLLLQSSNQPAPAVAAANSCDQGVKHHAAAGTLNYEQGWHGGGAVPFAGAQHITVSYVNGKGITRRCHVFDVQKNLGGCYFTTCV